MSLTGKGKIAGVIGWPVTHSLSPVLHGHWLAEYHIDGAMVPLAATREDFAAVIDGVRRAGFKGVNVTVPHKEAAFALAHSADDAAKHAGAANLLVFRENGTIHARNTDTYGLFASIKEALGPNYLLGKRVVVLGAGGAARGVVAAMISPLGASWIHILNRDVEKARNLAKYLSAEGSETELIPGSLDDWASAAKDASLVINSTSAGMGTIPPLNIDLGALPKSAAVCDIVYNPLETKLLKDAAARGHKTIDGLGMLMHQAVPSFEEFFGESPIVTSRLRDALVKVLSARPS
jgi:shikimate dehydrogenase